jgi:Carbohydrate family 9 binding domain-like
VKRYVVRAQRGALDWSRAELLTDFSFPWEATPPSPTAFRALLHEGCLRFRFECVDQDLILAEGQTEKERVLGSDRVEIFFATSLELSSYFCLEMDPRGLVYQYRARHYRQFDDAPWAPALELRAALDAPRYAVEGSLPLACLRDLGVLAPGGRELLAGVYRADFSRRSPTVVHFGWMSWVSPASERPDFHLPSSFGTWLLDEPSS